MADCAAEGVSTCDHVYASQHVPGHLVYWVRQCTACHAIDWDDLDNEIRQSFARILTVAEGLINRDR